MKRILLDESVPEDLRHALKDFSVKTVRFLTWQSLPDKKLLEQADGKFDVFITCDKNIPYQIKAAKYSFAIIILPTNKYRELVSLQKQLISAIQFAAPGKMTVLKS
jgi:hypothetical protein